MSGYSCPGDRRIRILYGISRSGNSRGEAQERDFERGPHIRRPFEFGNETGKARDCIYEGIGRRTIRETPHFFDGIGRSLYEILGIRRYMNNHDVTEITCEIKREADDITSVHNQLFRKGYDRK